MLRLYSYMKPEKIEKSYVWPLFAASYAAVKTADAKTADAGQAKRPTPSAVEHCL